MSAELTKAAVYTDFSQFEALRTSARNEQQQALPEVAKQFESIFLQMVVKSMRDAQASLSEDSFFKSDTMDFYQDMFDQQLSLSLADGKGLGLAGVLVRQLGGEVAEQKGEKNQLSSQSIIDTIKQQIDKLQAVNTQDSKVNNTQNSTKENDKVFSNSADFVKSLLPYAKKFAAAIGLDPKILLAQAALETGWGKSVIQDSDGANSHNLFNIKTGSQWQKESVNTVTKEYEQGQAVKKTAPFRKYASYEESFADYIQLLTSHSRYDAALKQADDPQAYIQALQDAGYATDPSYAKKVYSIYQSPALNQDDLMEN